jgi:hypothetical protein
MAAGGRKKSAAKETMCLISGIISQGSSVLYLIAVADKPRTIKQRQYLFTENHPICNNESNDKITHESFSHKMYTD